MPSAKSRRVSQALADRLHSAAIHLLRRVRSSDEDTGLSPARLSLLSVLVFGGSRSRSLGELARAEQVTAPTVTVLVKALERGGYVRRRADPDDGRSWLVSATAKARRVLRRARQARIRNVVGLLGELSARDRLALDRVVALVERRVRTSGAGRPETGPMTQS